jgi:soluble lytic murein transglycosylase
MACRGTGNAPAPAFSSHPPSPDLPPVAVTRADVTGALLPSIAVVLDDPRARAARERDRAHDAAGAATGLDAARAVEKLSTTEDCAWSYAAAKLHVAAGELAEGASLFDRVTDRAECAPLATYAATRAAQAYGRSGRGDLAIARARTALARTAVEYPENRGDARRVVDEEAKLVLAEALAAKGDTANAVTLWRELLTDAPHASRWVDTSVRLATALLDDTPPDAARAKEALDLATRVVTEAPRYAENSGASAVRTRAITALRREGGTYADVPDALSEPERIRLAQAWLDLGDTTRSLTESNPLVAGKLRAGTMGPLACRAATLRAQAVAKTKASSADAWGDAIRLCQGDDALVTALYSGGKSSAIARRWDEAEARFSRVEQEFGKHRLADDARFQRALAAEASGDSARALTLFTSVAGDFPEGDMGGEALFRVALAKMTAGDWRGATEPLDRILSTDHGDQHWLTAGRAQYYRARASAKLGDSEGARTAYRKVLREHPLAFYMTQAYARLAADDPESATRELSLAMGSDDGGTFPAGDHPELHHVAFQRACRLLEVGEIDAARREFAASGALAPDVDPEVVWIIGHLYELAGAPELGHAFSRGRVTDFLAHYPVARWRLPWEIAFPRAFEPLVVKESGENGVPVSLTWAIMREESSFFPEARSSANAIGLMQLIGPTARWMAKGTPHGADEAALKKPEVSIALGTRLLAKLRASFASNEALAIAAYNGGGGAVGRWVAAHPEEDFDLFVEQIPFEETRGYVKRVVASEAAYAFLYEPAVLPRILALPAHVTASR